MVYKDGKGSRKNMIKPIMRDIFFLNQKSEPATEEDKQVAIFACALRRSFVWISSIVN